MSLSPGIPGDHDRARIALQDAALEWYGMGADEDDIVNEVTYAIHEAGDEAREMVGARRVGSGG